ncbi:sorting and assembly machinery component 50 homolog B-like [Punica granatum]|uniref:Sorting and assembly machinery component 50 homolog B-like n=2 Tax=Punica granatum TaxID=22663 RepID=A0A6P8BTQ3_PUNGR|nr:sorting and assembly machinery component 50 homolog B-like [Punica granatum]PKI46693.1 hypothetical protein CRG98_033035 [Punica granatum]
MEAPEQNPTNGGERDPQNRIGEDEEEEEEDSEAEDDDYEPEPPQPLSQEAQLRAHKARLTNLSRKLSSEQVPIRVHDVLVKGNTKTKDWVIEAELEDLKRAGSLQELLQAASLANFRLQQLGIFHSVNIVLDSGPKELPGTANVVVNVVEASNPLSGEIGYYTKPEARSSTVEGVLKFKNLLGYGDLWDTSFAYGWNQTSELSAGVFLPRFKSWATPLIVRVFLITQDWLKYTSYNERSMGLSLGLLSSRNHDLTYNLAWRTLADPSQMSSRPVRRQLGHGLSSALKYIFRFDRRNSPVRPTQGYAFVSTTQLGGLFPDSRSLRFLRQEIDLRYAVPLGFYHAALNFGMSAGVLFPWGRGFLEKPSSLPERFFLGGNSSPFSSLGGPTSLLGFGTRGVGPAEPRRQTDDESSERDFVGGDIAVTAFADLSFDLPFKWSRKSGIYGHVFACAGNLAKLSQNEFRNFSFQNFVKSYRSSVGAGIVVPTNIVRLEVNYCYVLRQFDFDRGKAGLRVSFSST